MTEVKLMKTTEAVMNKSLLCTYQKTVCKLKALKPKLEWGSGVCCYYIKQLIHVRRQWLVFLHREIGYSIRMFLIDRELVNGYCILILGNSLSFAYKQEMTQVKLGLQNKLNQALFV